MYLLIEGVDLAGKSTIVKKLAEKKDLKVNHSSLTPPNPILNIAKEIDKDGSEWIGHLYVEALKWDLDHFTKPKEDTIQDSTILLRSLAYNTAANYSDVTNKLESMAFKHPLFDKVFILTASLEARVNRLRKRMENHPHRVTVNDLKIIRDPQFFVKMEEAMIRYATFFFKPIIIDTTNKSVSEVLEIIIP